MEESPSRREGSAGGEAGRSCSLDISRSRACINPVLPLTKRRLYETTLKIPVEGIWPLHLTIDEVVPVGGGRRRADKCG